MTGKTRQSIVTHPYKIVNQAMFKVNHERNATFMSPCTDWTTKMSRYIISWFCVAHPVRMAYEFCGETRPFSTAQTAICTRESNPSLYKMRVT